MRITQEVDYGFRVILYLCKLDEGKRIEAKIVSAAENIPLRFLLKLLRKLAHSEIVKSYRGIGGGYSLNKLPQDISLKDVVEAIDGPIYMNRCLYDKELCNLKRASYCGVHKALSKVQNNLIKNLENITFKDILDDNL